MRRRTTIAVVAVALAVSGGVTPLAVASSSPAPLIRLAGVVPGWAQLHQLIRPAPAGSRIDLAVGLRTRHNAALTRLIHEVSDPASPRYRHFLTAAQYRARFAPTTAAAAAVRGWLTSRGVTVDGTTPSRTMVYAHGSTDVIGAALDVGFGLFRRAGQLLRAPLAAPAVPAAVANLMTGISGLAQTSMRPAAAPPPAFYNARPCSAHFGQKAATKLPKYAGHRQHYAVCGYTPRQIRSAYGLGPHNLRVGKHRLTGQGVTIAIVDAYASPTVEHDVNTYSARHGLPRLRPGQLTQTTFGPLGNPPEVNLGGLGLLDPQGWSSEETLDVEAVHAIAPRARIHYFGALTNLNSTLYLALAQAVDSGAQVVSNSYGSGDDAPLVVDKLLFDSIARQAAARGVTLDFSTGDDGDEVAAEGFRTADFPATSDLVTAVGGTSLKIGRRGQWRGETYWGDQKIPLSHGRWDLGHAEFNGAAGGGVSRSYAEPAWQRGVVPNSLATDGVPRPGRVEPDLSMVGDPTTGFRIGQTMTPSRGGARYVEYRIGGTSLSCPLFSGLVALAVQLRHGRPLGLVTPTLYHAARTAAGRTRLFHEPDTVTTRGGQSLFANVRPDYADPANTASKVSVTLRTLGNLGTLHALRGYDDSTGLGTPKAGPLVSRLG